jgi:hypothetical protein
MRNLQGISKLFKVLAWLCRLFMFSVYTPNGASVFHLCLVT